MRKAPILISVFGLALSAQAQTPRAAAELDGVSSAGASSPQRFVSPGGFLFQAITDEMTDHLACTVATPMLGVWLEFYGKSGATIRTSEKLTLDYSITPIMRIGAGEPFELDMKRRPHLMSVPEEHLGELVNALYSGSTVRVRFTLFPNSETRTFEIASSGFALAYDHGTEMCGWPMPRVARAILSHEPQIVRTDESLTATFGGPSQWSVFYMPKYRACHLGAPFGVLTMISMGHQFSSGFSAVKVYRRSGELVATLEAPNGAGQFSVARLIDAAAAAGSDGMLEVNGQLYSTLGLVDAVLYAPKTCDVSFN